MNHALFRQAKWYFQCHAGGPALRGPPSVPNGEVTDGAGSGQWELVPGSELIPIVQVQFLGLQSAS